MADGGVAVTLAPITRKEYIDKPLVNERRGLYWDRVPIMAVWEQPYILAYVNRVLAAYAPESVLEIGFGLGYTAQAIFDSGVTRHVIVECHPQIVTVALAWAADKPVVTIVPGWVEDIVLPTGFDLIWDDRHDLTSYGEDWVAAVRARRYHRYQVLDMLEMTDREYSDFASDLKADLRA